MCVCVCVEEGVLLRLGHRDIIQEYLDLRNLRMAGLGKFLLLERG